MKVSIIIPVYNVEAYIADCLKSVASQTYADLECILVDDCGNDNSIVVAEKFIEEYKGPVSFKIIHQERNTGPGARNAGIKVAAGEYLFFLDSDDQLAEDCIESLARPLTSRHYDMVMGDYVVEGGEDRFIHLRMSEGECLGRENIAFAKRKHLWSPMVWGKLYRRVFLVNNGILFCEGIVHEDELFFAEIACLAQSIYCLPNLKCYRYKVHSNSIMTATPYSRKMESCKVLLRHMYDFLKRNSLQKDPVGNDMLYVLFSFSNEVSWRESKKEFLDRYPEYRAIVCRKYGERLAGDKRIKAVIRDFHYLLPPGIGKYLFELVIDKSFVRSFIRFCVVGVSATAIHYGIYWLMLKMMTPTPAFTIGYIISFCFNFFLTAKFTFKKKATPKKGVGFALSHLVNYGLETGALNVFLLLGLREEIAAIPVYFICVPINFLLVRFVFSKL